MPKAQPLEDDYWGCSDKEMVRLRGVCEYVGWILCGGRNPIRPIPPVRDTAYDNAPIGTRVMLYGGNINSDIHSPQAVQRFNYGQYGQRWRSSLLQEEARRASLDGEYQQIMALMTSAVGIP